MPVATRRADTVRYELKVLPGAWVELRQLSYDEMLERRDGATKMLMESSPERGANPQWAMQVANKWSNHFSFSRCITDHNLTDDKEVPLDFSKPDQVFRYLDPKVGQEIERLIDELNNEEAVDAGNFQAAHNSSSSDGMSKRLDSSEES